MDPPERVVEGGWSIRWLEETDSTNRVAADEARAGAAEGLVVVADHQRAGRGRLGRTWEAAPGSALLMSVLLRPALPPERWHLLTATVGLAAADACASVAGVAPGLKWPNDLLVREAKLAGVLAEVAGGAVVVGLGLNVSAAPPGALSLVQAAGRPVDRQELMDAVLDGVAARAGRWDEVATEYANRCATVGSGVRVEGAGGVAWEGRAVAVDGEGRLVVEGPDGTVALSAADVTHLRAAAAPDRYPHGT